MHLAIVTPYPPAITGIGQYGFYTSQELARSGVFKRVTLLTSQAGREPESQDGAGTPLHIERVWRPGRPDVGRCILERLGALQPDLVWYNLGASVFGRNALSNLSGLLVPVMARRVGLPSVVTIHEMVQLADLQALQAPGGRLARYGASLITFIATRADVVCVTMRRNAEYLRARWPSVHVIHIPIGAYNAPEALPESGEPELLIFTSFAPFKGLELLLEAFRQLAGRFPGLKLSIAGADHPRFPGYLARARQVFGEHPGVRWLGSLPEQELKAVFQRASIVVLPYTATTGSSSVLARAAAWGRPVVASDMPELRLATEEAGLQTTFFHSGDPGDLGRALEELLGNPASRQVLAAHNLRAAGRLSLEATGQAYLQAFNLALAACQRRSVQELLIHPIELSPPGQA